MELDYTPLSMVSHVSMDRRINKERTDIFLSSLTLYFAKHCITQVYLPNPAVYLSFPEFFLKWKLLLKFHGFYQEHPAHEAADYLTEMRERRD